MFAVCQGSVHIHTIQHHGNLFAGSSLQSACFKQVGSLVLPLKKAAGLFSCEFNKQRNKGFSVAGKLMVLQHAPLTLLPSLPCLCSGNCFHNLGGLKGRLHVCDWHLAWSWFRVLIACCSHELGKKEQWCVWKPDQQPSSSNAETTSCVMQELIMAGYFPKNGNARRWARLCLCANLAQKAGNYRDRDSRQGSDAGRLQYEIQKWSIGFTIVVHGLRVVRLTDDLTDVNTYLMNLPINSLIIACHARIFNSNCTAITK